MIVIMQWIYYRLDATSDCNPQPLPLFALAINPNSRLPFIQNKPLGNPAGKPRGNQQQSEIIPVFY